MCDLSGTGVQKKTSSAELGVNLSEFLDDEGAIEF